MKGSEAKLVSYMQGSDNSQLFNNISLKNVDVVQLFDRRIKKYHMSVGLYSKDPYYLSEILDDDWWQDKETGGGL